MILWLILGAAVGVGCYWLITKSGFSFQWYEWVLVALGVVLILFSIQNYSASMVELEPRAAGYLLAIFGVPGLIFAGAGLFLASKRKT